MRTLVMGDIHGAAKAVIQCLDRCNFDPASDTLIQLGDVADGYDEVYESVEILLKIPKLISICGNHDAWLLEFIETGYHPWGWAKGGKGTIRSYGKLIPEGVKIIATGNEGCKTSLNPEHIPITHQQFFKSQRLYYIDELNNCFVHAGFDRQLPFADQRPANYYWDRTLWREALNYHINNLRHPEPYPFHIRTKFHEIFIGHTPTTSWQTDKPMRAVNVLNIDTGARSNGKLTIMDVETKEYWQSDLTADLYMPNSI